MKTKIGPGSFSLDMFHYRICNMNFLCIFLRIFYILKCYLPFLINSEWLLFKTYVYTQISAKKDYSISN